MGLASTIYGYIGGFCLWSMAQFGLSPRKHKNKLLSDLKSSQGRIAHLGETLLTGANGLRDIGHAEILCYYLPVYKKLLNDWLEAPVGSEAELQAQESISELNRNICERLEKLDS